jgi:hypothetical protein
MLIKTRRNLLPAIESRLRELHSYEVPELVAFTKSKARNRISSGCLPPRAIFKVRGLGFRVRSSRGAHRSLTEAHGEKILNIKEQRKRRREKYFSGFFRTGVRVPGSPLGTVAHEIRGMILRDT